MHRSAGHIGFVMLTGGVVALAACGDAATGPIFTDPRLFLSVTAGDVHTCGLITTGTGLCWGRGWGALGTGSIGDRRVPTAVAGGHRFAALSTRSRHTCALTADGTAYCWGHNDDGALGVGTGLGEIRDIPAAVATTARFTSIATGATHTCALDAEGTASCWGSNRMGQLGAEATDSCFGYACSGRPVPVHTDLRFQQVALGGEHSCAVTAGGVAYCWGSNAQGQLGASTSTECERQPDNQVPCSPSPIAVQGGHRFAHLSAGAGHTCGITRDGAAYCWGGNTDGQLGVGDVEHRTAPTAVAPDAVTGARLTFTAVSAGLLHTCGVTAQSQGYCWGRQGVLGDAAERGSNAPLPISTTVRFTDIGAGGSHSCGISLEGLLYCWGSNQYGQLGDGSGALGWPTPVVVWGW